MPRALGIPIGLLMGRHRYARAFFHDFVYLFANSWKLAALAETFVGYLGIGFQLEKAFQTFSVVTLFAWTFFFVLFVILVERVLITPLERRVFAWRDPAGARERVA